MLTEGKHAGEFIVSEGNGAISRDGGTVKSGQKLVAGELVGIETATGDYVAYDPADTIAGSDTVAGIAFDNYDATSAAVSGVFIGRLAEVRSSDLTYNEAVSGTITAELEALKALNIIVR